MKKRIALLLALTLLLCGCSGKTFTSQNLMEEVKPTQQNKAFITIGTDTPETFDPETDTSWDRMQLCDFGLRLFRASFDAEKNTLISPYSVLAALAMTANGAEGNTLTQMEEVLGQSREALNSWHKFGTDYEDNTLQLANGIWFKDDPAFTVNEAFLQKSAECFGAGIYKAPFDDTTLTDINCFVEDNTDGMVKNILDKIPEDAVMYLVNALAFDAKWKEAYKENQVHKTVFTTEDGTEQKAELMWSEESIYYENDLATGFQKPYKDEKTDRFAFVALLPKEGVAVADLVAGLDGGGLQEMLGNPQMVKVNAAVPKFEAEFDTQMSQVLKAMGMTDAFDSDLADFSSLGTHTNGGIFINRVIHKTFISVAEQGTKAGAATVVEAAAEGAIEEVKQVVLDRPFLYMIVDIENNTPVFIGSLMEIQ